MGHGEDVRLAPYTTLRMGGPARRFIEATTDGEIIRAVSAGDDPVLVLGGGSNLVISEDGFNGTVVHVGTRGVDIEADGTVIAQAGEDWDDLVAQCVRNGLSGIECLAGIPGLVGATPIQNVGAYGQEVAETIRSVAAYDREEREIVRLAPEDCGFGYRNSRFKGSSRWVVLSVIFKLDVSADSRPIAYAELAKRLGVPVGATVPLADARAAVLSLRAAKGMVLDAGDPDTRSAGSFFTNPVLTEDQAADLERRAPGFPRWPASGGVKVPAAWLIDQAGFTKGYARGAVRISSKHTLALTNPSGTAGAGELLELAREVRDGVFEKFGVGLVNEPTLVGCAL